MLSVPNFGHWYPRLRATLGMFDYDQRGILDATHVRFFTRRSIRKLVERSGFTVRRMEPVGLPLDAIGLDGTKARMVRLLDHFLVTLWPTLFGYQFILEATPEPLLNWRMSADLVFVDSVDRVLPPTAAWPPAGNCG